MDRIFKGLLTVAAMVVGMYVFAGEKDNFAHKPSPAEVMKKMQEGNIRYVEGKSLNVNNTPDRKKLAAAESQGKYAYATVLSCSDSRVPVELIFDAGVMDIFVIRVAGNICNTDEIGSIEYGACHVNTPLVIIMGHSQCGAVTAVSESVTGHGHKLEKNIPPLVKSIVPTVKKTMEDNPGKGASELLDTCIEECVWHSIDNLFMESSSVREMVKKGKIKVVGAIYDVESGKVKWLSEDKVSKLLEKAESSPESDKADSDDHKHE